MSDYQWFWPRYIAWIAFCIGGAWLIVGLLGSCANETAERKHWQDCGAVYHEVCYGAGAPDAWSRDCEYEFYKECINGG
jgi:hypothetical protein